MYHVGAKVFSVMHESIQMHKLNTLVGTRVSLTIKKSKGNGYTIYNVTHLGVLHKTACVRACVLFQAELQTGDEASTCARSTSPVPSSSNITIDYPVNAMKKTFARYIACGVDELTKLCCYGCEKDHPSQRQHECFF